MIWQSGPLGSLKGEIAVPGDKSVSHRALIFGALSERPTRIRGLLRSEDVDNTRAAVAQLGAHVEQVADAWHIQGSREAMSGPVHIDCGNSGTTMRLLCGFMAGRGHTGTLYGDASLSRRPMRRIITPLVQMGAVIQSEPGGLAPLVLSEGTGKGISYELPMASAQLKSALILGGMQYGVRLKEPGQSRDHTERLLGHMGVDIRKEQSGWLNVEPFNTSSLYGLDITVPGDLSSAAFWLVAASIVPDSSLLLPNVGLNPTRTGCLDVLIQMGARLTLGDPRENCGEPVADIHVQSSPLHGCRISGDTTIRCIDELPILAVAAAFSEGVTEIRDAQELRVKESDRIAVVAKGLQDLGFHVEEYPDGLRIEGGQPTRHAEIQCHGDHRIAMAFRIAGLAGADCTIHGAESVATSYPDFLTHLEAVVA